MKKYLLREQFSYEYKNGDVVEGPREVEIEEESYNQNKQKFEEIPAEVVQEFKKAKAKND